MADNHRLFIRKIILLAVVFIAAIPTVFASESRSAVTFDADSTLCEVRPDTAVLKKMTEGPLKRSDSPDWWVNRLKNNTLNLKDTSIIYPKFMGFCIKVYNWADRVFNTYDTTYVQGTGKRWKAMLKSDNWADSYAFNFHHTMPVRLMSDIYCSAGVYLQYMAVSAGYSLDLTNVIGNKPILHKRMELGFSCSLFSVDFTYTENTGGSYVRKFGDFNNGKLFKLPFPGVTMHCMTLDGYYFFNHKRYSQGAAYNYAKLQKKSAGSFMVGFAINTQNINLEMNTLPEQLKKYLNSDINDYRIHYNSYCLLFGYGYNVAFGNNWIYNATIMPSIGVSRCYDDSIEGRRDMVSLNIKGKTSLTWNISNYFLGMDLKFDGHWYKSSEYSFFNSIENANLCVGVRF